MNGIDSKILIKILKNISPEITQESLSYLLLSNDGVVKRLIYGRNGESYWPRHTDWLKNAPDYLGFGRETYQAVGINLLELLCKKNKIEIISLEQQFIDLFEEVFSIYLNSEFKRIVPLVLRVLEEEHVVSQEISHVRQLQDISSLIYFLVNRAKNKGEYPKMTSSTIPEPNTSLHSESSKVITNFKIDADLPYIKDFAGNRAIEINEIDKHFENNSLLFLSGMGGIGKSVLALLYAKQKIISGTSVYFLRFQKSFESTITSLAISGFDPYDKDGKAKDSTTAFGEKIELMKRYCSSNSLFIIDNVYENNKTLDDIIYGEDSYYAFEKILSLPGKLLLTTRYEVIDFPNKEVGSLPTNDLLEIMDSFYKYTTEESPDLRIDLINIVHHHTLTVELLARTLKALRGTKTPEEVLMILSENISAGDSLPKIHSDNNNKKESIFKHLCNLFSISGLSELELILLSQASMIGDSGLMSSIFFECCYNQNNSIDDCNNLIEKGWINYDIQTESFSMHPLIQSVLNREIQDKNELKIEFLDKLLNLKTADFKGSLQIAEIILKAFQNGFPFNMDAVDLLFETSNRLTDYIITPSKNHFVFDEEIYYIQKCIQIDSISFDILQQIVNSHNYSTSQIESRKLQLMKSYEDWLNTTDELYTSDKELRNTVNDLSISKVKLERLENNISKMEEKISIRKEVIGVTQRDTANIEKQIRKLDLDVFKKIEACFSSLNHPYFDECLKLLEENWKEADELDLTIMFKYANSGVKNDILQSYLLLSLCYRWGAGVTKNLQLADEYQKIYLDKKSLSRSSS